MKTFSLTTATKLVGGLSAAALATATLLLASASSVSAPEPARLDGSLTGTATSTLAVLISSNTPTYAYQFGSSWAPGSVPAGTPCATYAATPGTILTMTIRASGAYRKCM